MRNLSTKTRPEGGALMLILDRWISNLQMQVAGEFGRGYRCPQRCRDHRQSTQI